jgi:hypothetical protein
MVEPLSFEDERMRNQWAGSVGVAVSQCVGRTRNPAARMLTLAGFTKRAVWND